MGDPMFRMALMALTVSLAGIPVLAGDIATSVDATTLAKKKQTPLGLYLTPSDAHAALQEDPAIVFIDVRDPIEISFVGHPNGMDANVPVRIASHKFDARAGRYDMPVNPNFIRQAEEAIARAGGDKDSAVFLTCRSGGRSAVAARMLIEAGYTSVWNLVEGFEGDMDKATQTRSLNGWRNAGLPWSYKIPASVGWSGP